MRKDSKKQKIKMIFPVAVIALGCIISAIYANQNLSKSNEYNVDLSKLNMEKQEDAGKDADKANDGSNEEQGNVPSQQTSTDSGSVINPGTNTKDEGSEKSGSETKSEGNERTGSEIKEKTKEEEKSGTNARTSRNAEEKTGNPTDEKTNKDVNGQTSDSTKQKTDDASNPTNDANEKENFDKKETMSADGVQTQVFEQEGMTWPVMGNVIMNYSMDSSVYFETLNEYKYNPALLISASVKDNVSACAKGIVEEIGNTSEIGNYVKMNLGDGYELVYGQLQDILVKEGQSVARGQVIASVAPVSRYYTREGDHVYLCLTQNGEHVNPMNYLK